MRIECTVERWPLAERFVIARGAKREAAVVIATIDDGHHAGRGECVPYARYGETIETVVAAIEGVGKALARDGTREALARLLPAGAARNALDCALWDYEAKRQGTTAASLAGLEAPHCVDTAYTISLGTPEEMADKARASVRYPLLKLKLGGEGDAERLAAVREAVPAARLVADANEAWREEDAGRLMLAAAAAGIELVEQPLPAGRDQILARIERTVPVCADESAHDRTSLPKLRDRYDAVNIKLDKTGGLTEALAASAEAKALGFQVMIGCMVATSLAMAPAVLAAQSADYVDLDGPLLLARDREPGLAYDGCRIAPPVPALWG